MQYVYDARRDRCWNVSAPEYGADVESWRGWKTDGCSPLAPAELAVLRAQYEKEGEMVGVQTKFNYAWVCPLTLPLRKVDVKELLADLPRAS